MMKSLRAARALALLPLVLTIANPAPAAMQEGPQVVSKEVWKPAKTPPGGISWRLLETTRLNDRTDPKTRIIYTKPTFPKAVRALSGKRIKVAGWMMPLENGIRQKHFVLMAYPPDCPFHINALPNQFSEVYASVPVKVSELKPIVVTGTLQLTGHDESGIFYKLKNAAPVDRPAASNAQNYRRRSRLRLTVPDMTGSWANLTQVGAHEMLSHLQWKAFVAFAGCPVRLHNLGNSYHRTRRAGAAA